MAWGRRIKNDVAALASELETLDGKIAQSAEEISASARAKSLSPAWQQVSGEAAFSDIFLGWAKARRSIADLVSATGRRVDAAMAPLEDKPQPARGERLKLRVQHMLSLDWRQRRVPQVGSLDQALLLADRLYGLLAPRRERIIALRHSAESDLVELMGHRSLLADAIASTAEQEEREPIGVSRMVEHGLQAVQDLTAHLNKQVQDMNAALNKLTVDSERAIVLTTVLAGGQVEPSDRHTLDKAEFSNLASLIDLNQAGMLSSRELERRRGRIDARFAETFGEPQASADKEEEVQDKREVGHA